MGRPSFRLRGRVGVRAFRAALLLGMASLVWVLAVPPASGLSLTADRPAAETTVDRASNTVEQAKGPIGWDVYRRLDLLPKLASGVRTVQTSSYDRDGGNDDAVAGDGTGECVRITEDGCVIAEHTGAGEIQSIWLTHLGLIASDDASVLGTLIVELDGQRIIEEPVQDLVNGSLGAPFVWPLVANTHQSSGGVYIKVPMPFRTSMRVTVEATSFLFYHVTYRTFADAAGVRTFDPTDRAEDVIAMLRRAGRADPAPPDRNARTVRAEAELAPGASMQVASLRGRGAIRELKVRIPEIVGPTVRPTFVDDGRAFHAGGSSEFTVAIDPANDGVRLTRRLDTFWAATQVVAVFVDGVPVSGWSTFPGKAGKEWSDAVALIPPELTRDKSQLVIRNVWSNSILGGFEEFRYWVDSKVGGEYVRTDTLDVGPDATASEEAHGYRIVGEQWQGRRWAAYPPTGDRQAIARSDELLEKLRLRITFDGETTVDAPLGEFFGTGLGEYAVTSLLLAVDPSPDGWYTSWWPMPFERSATVELVNGSDETVALAEGSVAWRRGGPKGLGRFHATSERGHTVDGEDWTFLDVEGAGKVVGVSHTMLGEPNPASIGSRNYLEGDERVWVDGEATPSLHGTGTEDFYEGGWYFRTGTFSNPMNGAPGYEIQDMGCDYSCTSAYRLLIGDAIQFTSSIRFGIEHGGDDTWPAVYGSTTYWYGAVPSGPADRS